MKIHRIIILALLSLTLSGSIYSQTRRNIKLNQTIDSISIFPAIGVIKCAYGRKALPNDSLNLIFLDTLAKVLPTTTSGFKINYLSSDMELSDSLKKYFVNTIPKFSNLTEETFSVIPLGASFNKMIEKVPGRYFGIIFYEGFVQYDLAGQIGTSIAIGVATSLLTKGLFSVSPAPATPYLISDMLIIDKESNRFLFYRRQLKNGYPLDPEKISKVYTKIFNEYKYLDSE